MKEKILIVDDEPSFLITTKTILKEEGYEVTTAEDGFEAIYLLKKQIFDVVLADLKMPGKDGMEVIAAAKKVNPHTIGIIITGYPSLDTAIEAIEKGCYDYIPKPYHVEDLKQIIKRGVDKNRLEQEVFVLKEKAEFYNDLMAHDINNINQIIMGYLSALSDSGLREQEQKDYVEKALSAVKRSAKLIENVRKLRQIQEIEPELKAIDLTDIIKESIDSVKADHKDKEVEINYIPSEEKQYILADSFANDIFINILDNAIKFTPFTKVEIDIGVVDYAKNEKEFYVISVEDRGRGVPDEAKEAIFKRFHKGHKYEGGSGIGLYLVKTLVSRYGGGVWVEDRVKGDHALGSIFNIIIPKPKGGDND
jgi:two-component system sensor histidine kinase/response regulator